MFASVCADEITEAEDEFVVSGLDKQEEGSGGEGCIDGGGEAVGDSCRAPKSVHFNRLWSIIWTFSENWSIFGIYFAEKSIFSFYLHQHI